MESLTDELERRARGLLAQIDELGGSLAAIEAGFFAREIQASSVEQQRHIDSGEVAVVGLNKYRRPEAEDAAEPAYLHVDAELERRQQASLAEVRAGRDAAAVQRALEALREAVAGEANLMPPIIEAVRAYASIGEICGVMREQWGEYEPPAPF